MLNGVNFGLNNKLYIKDPQGSQYGRNLLNHAVDLLSEIGLENFTFKKLGVRMNSSETSIYRYFENKHLLHLYIQSWYWEWLTYSISINTLNISDPKEKLKKAIASIIYTPHREQLATYVDEENLYRIIVQEGSKSYHSIDVDKENKEGLFLPYKMLTKTIANLIKELNPQHKYPHTLSITVIEMIQDQIYFVEHLPRLSDLKRNKTTLAQLEGIVLDLIFKSTL